MAPGRWPGIDVARALALLGMVLAHTLPEVEAEGITQPLASLSGKPAALFAVLAGFSITLSTRRFTRWEPAAVSLVVRGLLLVWLGLVLGTITTAVAIILVHYGALFLLAPLVLRVSTRSLAVLAPAWLVLSPFLGFVVRSRWDLPQLLGSPRVTDLGDPGSLALAVLLTGHYPLLQWIGYALVGLLLSRLDWTRPRTAVLAVAGGAVGAVLARAASTLLLDRGGLAALAVEPPDLRRSFHGTTPTDTWWWLTIAAPHSGTPFDLVLTCGTAVLVIGLCMLAARRAASALGQVVVGPLAVAGAMPLTVYTVHVVLREATAELAVHLFLLGVTVVLSRAVTTRSGPLEWAVARIVAAALARLRPADPGGSGRPKGDDT